MASFTGLRLQGFVYKASFTGAFFTGLRLQGFVYRAVFTDFGLQGFVYRIYRKSHKFSQLL